MDEIKNKIITAESLKALHEHNKETYMSTTTIAIPAGRMRGDVDGDGKIDNKDVVLVQWHLNGDQFITDEMQLLCADIDNNGVIDNEDMKSLTMVSLFPSDYRENCADMLENWTINPNYKNEDMQYFTDIAVSGINSKHSAIITIVDTNYDKSFFRVELFDGMVRIYAKSCPISEVKAVVQYGNDNNANVVIVDTLRKYAKDLYGVLSISNGGTNSADGAKGLANLFASGATVLSSYQYGDKFPTDPIDDGGNGEPHIAGRIFFKRLVEE